MPKTDLVACFYWGQDSQNDEPMQVLTRAEVRQLKKDNKGYFIDHGVNFRLCQEIPVTVTGRPLGEDPSTSSNACISFSEMQANVGIVPDNVKRPDQVIEMAQTKVRWYERIRSYPELAYGRWPSQIGVEATA